MNLACPSGTTPEGNKLFPRYLEMEAMLSNHIYEIGLNLHYTVIGNEGLGFALNGV